MKTYLRVANPIIAGLVLLLCLWAASNDDNGNFKPGKMLTGGIPTYFVAKGLFCSSTLMLMGKIVAMMMERGK